MAHEIKFVDTTLRDAHQSLIATRLTTEEMLPILEALDQAGYHALEVWGGATFDVALRFLNEDPWERLRTIRKHVKHTKLQMLLRGQNLLGYKHYPDDIVETFIQKAIENGIDIIRVFDALNDIDNLRTAMTSIVKHGGHCQAAICYTISDVHTDDYYASFTKQLVALGAHSIVIKDMAGILTPARAYSLVKALKQVTDLPLEVHTHDTAGISQMTYLKAAEAGADIIDTAISSFAGGTSQVATESMANALSEFGYQINMDLMKLEFVADYFKVIKDKSRANGLFNPKVMDIEPKTLLYQVPGGMLSNLLQQLKESGNTHRYEEVLKEVPVVRAELGYPPLVTPISQMVGTQAVMNVITGERYKLVPKEIKDYVLGYYGKAPAPLNPEIEAKITGSETKLTKRPADLLAPMIPEVYAKYPAEIQSVEDMLMLAMFPQQALPFLRKRNNPFYDVPVQTVRVLVEA